MARLRRVYLDLDGVLFDFDRHAVELLGENPRTYEEKYGETAYWDRLHEHKTFYRTMPPMADAHELISGVQAYIEARRDVFSDPIVLSGVPKSNIARATEQKMAAVREHFPDLDAIFCLSRQKCIYCLPGDIIIDDWPKYKDLWEGAGGTFLLHTSAQDSLAQLRAVQQSPTFGLAQRLYPW